MLNHIQNILGAILTLIGAFSIVYILAYAVELAKIKAQQRLKVCNTCFKKMEAMNKVEDNN